jgi:hypothetical protein
VFCSCCLICSVFSCHHSWVRGYVLGSLKRLSLCLTDLNLSSPIRSSPLISFLFKRGPVPASNFSIIYRDLFKPETTWNMAHLHPRDERYRSPLPGGPFSIDSRGMSSRDIADAIQHAQFGIQPQEFIYGPAAPIRPRSPYPPGPPRFEDMANGYNHELHVHELVRKTNLAVSLANHNISPRAQYTQVHPMMCSDGKFPVDFQVPKTVEAVKLLDSRSPCFSLLLSCFRNLFLPFYLFLCFPSSKIS